MAGYRGRLLNPIKTEQEVYPYRRVWRSLIVEMIFLGVAVASVFVAVAFLGLRIPAALSIVISGILVVLPVGLWLLLSVLPERRVAQPRQRLFFVLILTALVANGIALPFLNDFLNPHGWLPHESAINRILGYTFSLGIVQEVAKYLVLRYSIWREHLRIRADAVAYAVAAAIAFGTMQNIAFILDNPALNLDIAALRIFENIAINVAASLFVSLGLAETRFNHPTPFFMTVTVALGALVTGFAQPLTSGLVNAAFSVRGSLARPIFGLGFSAAVLLVSVLVTLFLYGAAERREQDRQRAEDAR